MDAAARGFHIIGRDAFLERAPGDRVLELVADPVAGPHPLFKPLAWISGTGGEITVWLGKTVASTVLRKAAVAPDLGRWDIQALVRPPGPGGLLLVLRSLVDPFERQADMALEPATRDHLGHGKTSPTGRNRWIRILLNFSRRCGWVTNHISGGPSWDGRSRDRLRR